MNIKSKIVSFTVATAITFTFAAQAYAAVNPFTDLENTAAKEKIIMLQEKGYVKGVSNSLFAPNAEITAPQGIQLFVNAFELNLDLVKFAKEPKATDYFSKADDNAWYANALIIAAVNGLDFSRDLDPNQEWTREEFTYHLIKAMEGHFNLPMINLIPAEIADEDQLTITYSGAIQRALVYGVVKLDDEGKFNPKGKITRADASEEIYNALEYIKTHPAPKIEGAPGAEQ
ncbi:S-layer homology domain-containing protein [Sedimentibacter sp.]|uniref:S-layer homology domain-containing protein n=1 Tax=Sedimentibacter sp. TaxID=1960295 RepID=UPI0028ADB617|nr:S-layer homology domain-containing protein [Sedimentibacter sp.]